ncbi:MAG: hypothetical protein H0V44_09550 [Planctomycetes bacterium]|nr:hypothetical protein [Planctomycetota bacterium]
MFSLNAVDRGTGLRRCILNGLGSALAAAAVASELVLRPASRVVFTDGETPGGRATVRDELPLIELSGAPTDLGASAGRLLAGQIRPLLRLMGLHPPLIAARLLGRVEPLTTGIPDAHRLEIAAMAAAVGIPASRLERANLVVDTCCSALVRGADPTAGRPLAIGRNMDFYPAAVLGPGTMVALMRPTGKHAFVSVGWPGYAGVVSGMNAHGVCACILLNYGAHGVRPGTPIGFRAREVLEDAHDLAGAIARFSSSPVASSHYLLMADASGAAVCWHDGQRVHRHDLDQRGWLACSNGGRDPVTRQAIDDRGRCLRSLATGAPADPMRTEAWLRRAMTASYLRGINTQAMLFVPEKRILQLALGTGIRAAALNHWIDLDLTQAFAGAPLATAPLSRLPPVPDPARHYTDATPASDHTASGASSHPGKAAAVAADEPQRERTPANTSR